MTDLILHHYDASPFTQRVLRMLGIKGLEWRSVTTPMMPPKDDLLALTGGYRGTPVLQIGADVYIDSQRIARELETPLPAADAVSGRQRRCSPTPRSSGPTRSSAPGLHMAIGATSSMWPAEFRQDRQGLFPDIDFDGVDLAHARAQMRAHAGFIEQQLADGRAFLGGERARPARHPCLDGAVVHACVRAGRERAACAIARAWQAWEQRVAALGEGRRIECTRGGGVRGRACRRGPLPCAVRSTTMRRTCVSACAVEVAPDDTRRGAVRGASWRSTGTRSAVRRSHAQCGEVVVHFPRLGYRVTPLD